MSNSNIITLHANKPFTTSLAIAEGVGLEHANAIKLVRKFKSDFEEFGRLSFEIDVAVRKQGGGTALEYALLNEDQATYLITLFRNSAVVRKFKIQLVKAFRKALTELDYLRNRKSEPAWQVKRDETKVGFKWMNYNLKEQRAAIGKDTTNVHYMNEAKLINGVLAGIYGGIDRNTLPAKDLSFIASLQAYNARLIAQDMPYKDRKAALERYLMPKLGGVA